MRDLLEELCIEHKVEIDRFSFLSVARPGELGSYDPTLKGLYVYKTRHLTVLESKFILLHEFRHAIQYQHGLLGEWYGGDCKDPKKARRWLTANMVDYAKDFDGYMAQPHEIDANRWAYEEGEWRGYWRDGFEFTGPSLIAAQRKHCV